MIIKQLKVGELQTNCYIVADDATKESVIIDPGYSPELILKIVEDNKFTPKFIVNTHGHYDHVRGNKLLKQKLNVPVCIHKDDASLIDGTHTILFAAMGLSVDKTVPDWHIKEGDTLTFGSSNLKVIHTPGHTKGGISLYGDGILFTGDTLFAGDVGRTDLPGGSWEDLKGSVEKLLKYPDSTKVYPGHGPSTSVAAEKISWEKIK